MQYMQFTITDQTKFISVVISPVGMEDTLVLDIEPLCECECGLESSSSYDHTSEYCEYHGKICTY